MRIPMANERAPFRTDINGLRALAVSLVVLFHFRIVGFSGGFVGVDVFFVISGFLMTQRIMQAEFDLKSLSDFYRLRLARLFPALAALCVCLTILSTILIDPLQQNLLVKEELYAITFVSNIYYTLAINYFNPAASSRWLLHSWSLSLEWQFYILYPILLIGAGRLGGRRVSVFALVAMTTISLALCMKPPVYNPNHVFYLLPFRAWEMGFGGAVYCFPVKFRERRPLFLISLGVIILFSMFAREGAYWPRLITIIPVSATALLLWADADVGESFVYRSMRPLGAASYSLYLWHWPIWVYLKYRFGDLNGLATGAGLGLTVLLGLLSYAAIERPALSYMHGRQLRRTLALSTLAAGLSCAAAVVCSAKMVNLSASGVAPLPVWRDYIDASDDGPKSADCEGRASGEAHICTFKGRNPTGHRILVFGDSHARLWKSRLESMAPSSDIQSIALAAEDGCPSLPGVDNPFKRCSKFNHDMFALASSGRYDRIVIVSSWQAFGGQFCVEEDSPCKVPMSWEEVVQRAFPEFERQIRKIVSSKVEVVIFLPSPFSKYDLPVELARRRFLGEDLRELEELPRLDQESYRETVKLKLESLARFNGVRLADPFSEICDEDYCHTVDAGNHMIFRDSNHERIGFINKSSLMDPALAR